MPKNLHKTPIQGIYAITHAPSGRIYVGKAINIGVRWCQHMGYLKNDKANKNLQLAWSSDGPTVFSFSILEVVENSTDLFQREQYWIEKLNAASDPNFNICPYAGNTRGRIITEETRAKMRDSQRVAQISRKRDREKMALLAAQTGDA